MNKNNFLKTLYQGCTGHNKEKLLKYHIFLSKARLVADPEGLRLVEDELKRIRGKYLFLESQDLNEEIHKK